MATQRRILLIANVSEGFHRQVLSGVGQYARSATDWLFRSYHTWNEDDLCVRLIGTWRPDGVISLTRTWSPPLQLAHASGIPIVQANDIDDHPADGVPAACIHTDGAAVAELVADYFAGLGLRSVGYVGSVHGLSRRHGGHLRAAARRRGLAFADFHGEPRTENDPTRRFQHWLPTLPPRTGLLAVDDWFAWHVISEAVVGGFRVPDHFAVIGVGDDRPWCELAPVPTSSVAVAAETIGYRAASLLAHLMQGGRPAGPAVITVPPAGIVARRSTEVIAADDPDVAAALRYIHDHAAGGCTVKQVLSAVAIDRRRLERWCRQNLGRSPRDEIQRLRVAHVKRLLAETDERLEELARMAGFGSASLLCRTFHREAGITVAKYRRQFRRAKGTADAQPPSIAAPAADA